VYIKEHLQRSRFIATMRGGKTAAEILNRKQQICAWDFECAMYTLKLRSRCMNYIILLYILAQRAWDEWLKRRTSFRARTTLKTVTRTVCANNTRRTCIYIYILKLQAFVLAYIQIRDMYITIENFAIGLHRWWRKNEFRGYRPRAR